MDDHGNLGIYSGDEWELVGMQPVIRPLISGDFRLSPGVYHEKLRDIMSIV